MSSRKNVIMKDAVFVNMRKVAENWHTFNYYNSALTENVFKYFVFVHLWILWWHRCSIPTRISDGVRDYLLLSMLNIAYCGDVVWTRVTPCALFLNQDKLATNTSQKNPINQNMNVHIAMKWVCISLKYIPEWIQRQFVI